MLSVRGVSVRFGSVTAVDGVGLEVPDGSVLALLGPSGCGKSTLLRAIAGLEPVVGGSVSWDGFDLARIPVHRRGFGLMFQDGVLFPHRTVAGNVAYGLRRPGFTRDAVTLRVSELLEMVGLAGYGPRRVATLSGGEAQRVALARALAPQPRLLLLDEPLAALDRALRETLLADLSSVLARTGTTAIFVTHDQNEAFAIADRIAVMRSGAIVQTGPPREVWSHPIDEWIARFVGCTTVLDGWSAGAPGGGHLTSTAIGDVPGSGDLVGLRPSSLVLDAGGPLRGRCVAVTMAPDKLRLTVAMEGPPADRIALGEVSAVGDPDARVAVGDPVRLRLDPSAVALIGGDVRVVGVRGLPPALTNPAHVAP